MDIYAAALPGVKGLGAKKLRALIEYFGTARAVWETDVADLGASGILTPKNVTEFSAYRRETSPEETAEAMTRAGIGALTWKEEGYPPLLAATTNPPAVLFYRGAVPSFEKTVAIVGARKATAYGVNAARHIAEGLAKEGVTIVSGGARGIDTIAHEGCLAGGAPTVAVMACGLDITYPAENKNLFAKICAAGGSIVSEYPPGTAPLGRQFPARNRIIAGMSRGVLVTEAAIRSGSLITSDFALEEGRDVFSVPGSIWSVMSRGTNHLIRSGAICCTSPEDILTEYGWIETEEKEKKKEAALESLSLEEEMVYRYCTAGEAVSSEEILEQSGLSVPRLTMTLLSLTIKGYIKEAGAGLYSACR